MKNKKVITFIKKEIYWLLAILYSPQVFASATDALGLWGIVIMAFGFTLLKAILTWVSGKLND